MGGSQPACQNRPSLASSVSRRLIPGVLEGLLSIVRMRNRFFQCNRAAVHGGEGYFVSPCTRKLLGRRWGVEALAREGAQWPRGLHTSPTRLGRPKGWVRETVPQELCSGIFFWVVGEKRRQFS